MSDANPRQSFTELLDSARFDDETYRVTIPEDWMQGRTTFGGLSAALAHDAARRAMPDLPPLRSAMISFIGPAGGPVTGRTNILRQGKSVSFVETDISGEDGIATRATFAFGAERESIFDNIWTPPPSMPAPADCEPMAPKGLGPVFASHFDTKLAKGARPATGSKEHNHFFWVRHEDARATGVTALLAVADMPPPAVMPMFPHFKRVSSMTWMVNILNDNPISRDGWWLLQSRAENASHGYSSQDMLVWNSNMELTIAGRQSVAVFL